MAEWLRRWTWNPMGSPRAGSNPARCGPGGLHFLFFPGPLLFLVVCEFCCSRLLFRPKASAATAAIIGDGTERGRWEGSQRILCLGTVIPEHTAGSHPHGSGISPVRDPQQPLGAVCAGARSLHRKETLPHVQVEVPVQQFLAIASCPIAGQHRAEPGSTFLTPPLGIYTH